MKTNKYVLSSDLGHSSPISFFSNSSRLVDYNLRILPHPRAFTLQAL